jgi:hypothetical protein
MPTNQTPQRQNKTQSSKQKTETCYKKRWNDNFKECSGNLYDSVSVKVHEDQGRTGVQTHCTGRKSVQEGGVFLPTNVGRHIDGHRGQVPAPHSHKAPLPLNQLVGGASRNSGPEYDDRTVQVPCAP